MRRNEAAWLILCGSVNAPCSLGPVRKMDAAYAAELAFILRRLRASRDHIARPALPRLPHSRVKRSSPPSPASFIPESSLPCWRRPGIPGPPLLTPPLPYPARCQPRDCAGKQIFIQLTHFKAAAAAARGSLAPGVASRRPERGLRRARRLSHRRAPPGYA